MNRQIYFLNSMINIKHFDPNLLSVDQISFKKTDFAIYHIECITMESLGGENFLYLVFDNVDAYIEYNSTEESNGNKYFIFAFTDKNKEAIESYTELWDEIKYQIKAIR